MLKVRFPDHNMEPIMYILISNFIGQRNAKFDQQQKLGNGRRYSAELIKGTHKYKTENTKRRTVITRGCQSLGEGTATENHFYMV